MSIAQLPAYNQHFTDDEIKQLITFYETPVGQKTVKEMPQLVTELQSLGQKWGENLGRECMTEVLAEHPELEKEAVQAAQPAALPEKKP